MSKNKTKLIGTKRIDLGRATGIIPNEPIRFAPLDKVESANETRFYFEVFLSIGLTILGISVSYSNYLFFGIIFILISVFFLYKYEKKKNEFYKKYNH